MKNDISAIVKAQNAYAAILAKMYCNSAKSSNTQCDRLVMQLRDFNNQQKLREILK